jgi:hypothetical protein
VLAVLVAAVVLLGFAIAGRLPIAGGALAAIGAVGMGAGLVFATNPVLALGLGGAVAVCAVVLLLGSGGSVPRQASGLVGVLLLGVAAGVGTQRLHDFHYGPTHPSSRVAGPPAGAVRWVWSGGVTTTEATVVASLTGDGAGRAGLVVSPPVRAERVDVAGSTVRFLLRGLRPGARYSYALVRDGRDDGSGRGTFRTMPEGPASFTVAVSSCARSGSNGAVFDAIRDEDPLMFLHLGDLFYANIERNDPDAFRRAYDHTLSRPAQANLVRATSTAYIWDDHDFGGNDADGSSPSRPAASRVYRELVPSYPLALDGPETPPAQAFTIGRVRFLITDTRSARGGRGDGRTLLGEAQRRWFARELAAARRYALVVWVTPVSWVGSPDPSSDGWAGAEHERREIADLIVRTGVRDNLVVVSGDTHAVALDDGANSDFSTDRRGGFPVLDAGALDRERTPGKALPTFSAGAFPGGGRYGLIDVVDDGGDRIRVTLRGRTWNGRELVRLTRLVRVPTRATGAV